MSDAWVPYLALALSGLSLTVSVLAYRAGGPRLRLHAEPVGAGVADNPFPGGAATRLIVVNSGRAAVTVERFHVTPYGNLRPVASVDDVKGPSLPHRLDAHASETWVVDALPAAVAYDAKIKAGLHPYSSWPALFRFTVALGNGRLAKTRKTFDSLRMIADSRDKP